MDFPTRNDYRCAVEELARGTELSELDVARRAVATATRHATRSGSTAVADERLADPGHYLFGKGRAGFERDIGFRPPLRLRLVRAARASGIAGYGIAIAAVAMLGLGVPLAWFTGSGLWPWALLLFALVGWLPAVDAAVAIVNRFVTMTFAAVQLPALELRDGIPGALDLRRTMVVVPTLLTSCAEIAEQVERLEVHHLASPDGSLHFALLSDWVDAAAQQLDGDEELLGAAMDGIARLNARYAGTLEGPRFLLFHRPRQWNESERRWIGWERKRGKLQELNRLLRGARDTGFIDLGSALSAAPKGVRYVITLDADTRIPRETVSRLIGKMAHPLNQPRFDARFSQRVVEGYGRSCNRV